ncbi:glutaminyl-peptide cyclotransferase [Malassezia nana]|uniref:Peptide hydrolase n=1 Tax=Malassezia nana TaxID=180528 RepID=A0AAF0EMR0_9BASI|nr:glutaminyl-peptide cyclotransferase [Malassezia nana]
MTRWLVWGALWLAWLSVTHAMSLSDETIQDILKADARPWLDLSDPTSLLSRILIPRVPGTHNHTLVREALIDPFRRQVDVSGRPKWHIDTVAFEATTPLGTKNMTNIVLTRDPHAARKLVLAAHYDSKYFFPDSAEAGFIGATDSAFPCALLVDVAMALDAKLDDYTRNRTVLRGLHGPLNTDVSLEIVFFDGEEAFVQWSHTDSVYGAKNLAALWADTWTLPGASHWEPRHQVGLASAVRRIHTIDHMVLFDLLGAVEPSIPSFFRSTKHLHALFAQIERRLDENQWLWPPGARHAPIFHPYMSGGVIEDDHIPFLERGVPILHLIPYPFPSVWHTARDNVQALHNDTMQAWSKLARVFTAEYLGLP